MQKKRGLRVLAAMLAAALFIPVAALSATAQEDNTDTTEQDIVETLTENSGQTNTQDPEDKQQDAADKTQQQQTQQAVDGVAEELENPLATESYEQQNLVSPVDQVVQFDTTPVAITNATQLVQAIAALGNGGVGYFVLNSNIILTDAIVLRGVKDVTITIIAGEGDTITATGARHFRLRDGAQATLVLDGITLAGSGTAPVLSDALQAVGGIRVDNGSTLSLDGSGTSSIEDCYAIYGGAIRLMNGSSGEVKGITLQNNTAMANSSAIRVSNSSLTVKGSTITGNTVQSTGSGGTVGVNGGELTLQDSTISENMATRGGAIRVTTPTSGDDDDDDDEEEDEVDDEENDSTSLNNYVTIQNSRLENNTATRSGGGISIVVARGADIETDVVVSGGSISNNKATGSNGGGIYLQSSNTNLVYLQVTGTTISGNSAANRGGGVGISSSSLYGNMSFSGVAFSGNSASYYVDEISTDQKNEAEKYLTSTSYTSLSTNANDEPLQYLYNNYDVANRQSAYTVEYDLDGGAGTFEDAKVYASGAYVTAPGSEPTKTGHTFNGWQVWYTSSSDSRYRSWDFTRAISGSYCDSRGVMTLIATWTLDSLTVSFDTDGADNADNAAFDAQILGYGSRVAEPVATPEKFGHTFLGWYTPGGEKYTFDTAVEYGFTLTAKWEESDFLVTDEATFRRAMGASREVINIVVQNNIDFYNGITASSTTAQFQQIMQVTVNIMPKEGLSHARLTMHGNDRHFQVSYGADSPYELTVNLMNITVDSEHGYGGVEVLGGSTFTLNGVGDSGFEKITQNIDGGAVYVSGGSTLHMSGLALQQNVATGSGGGIYVGGDSTAIFTGITLHNNTAALKGGGIAVRDASRVSFIGGAITNNYAPIGGGAAVSMLSLEACVANGIVMVDGTAFSGNTAGYYVNMLSDTQLALEGYVIRDVTGFSAPAGQDSDMVHANALQNNYDVGYADGYYTIAYNVGNGSGTAPSNSYHYGTDGGVTATVEDVSGLTAPGSNYEFKEWNTQPDGGGAAYQPGDEISVDSSLTLYAVWYRPPYTVTFAANGGYFGTDPASTQDVQVTVLKGDTVSAPEASHSSLYFKGWYIDAQDGATAFDSTLPITENVTLQARWGAVEGDFIIVYHTEGGTPVSSVSRYFTNNTYTVAAGDLPVPTKTGYDFTSWNTAQGALAANTQLADSAAVFTQNGSHLELHLTAQYTPKSIGVQFDFDTNDVASIDYTTPGGSGTSAAPDTFATAFGSAVELIPSLKAGYEFVSWTIEDETVLSETLIFTVSTENTISVTLHTRPITYTVSVYDLERDPYKTYTLGYGEALNGLALPDFSTEELAHTGWELLDGTPVDIDEAVYESKAIYPQTSTQTYTVYFDMDGGTGSLPASLTVDYGSIVGVQPQPDKNGYTFGGWLVTGTQTLWNLETGRVYGDVYLTAVWDGIDAAFPGDTGNVSGAGKTSVDEVEIITDVNGSTGYRVLKGDTLQLAYTLQTTLPGSASAQYTWFLTNETGTMNNGVLSQTTIADFTSMAVGQYYVQLRIMYTDTAATGNTTVSLYGSPIPVTVYAPQHDVTFFYAPGDAYTTVPVQHLDAVTVPINPVKEGYTFIGWFTDEELTEEWDTEQPVTGPFGLYAAWYQNRVSEFTVHFVVSGQYMPDQVVERNAYATRPDDPEVKGYTFGGWYSDDAFEKPFDFETTRIIESTILYAKLDAISYMVQFQTNGGTAMQAVPAVYGSMLQMPSAPQRAGYTFSGWYKETMLVNLWDFATDVVDGDITLYAGWVANKPEENELPQETDGGETPVDGTPASETAQNASTGDTPAVLLYLLLSLISICLLAFLLQCRRIIRRGHRY